MERGKVESGGKETPVRKGEGREVGGVIIREKRVRNEADRLKRVWRPGRKLFIA